MITPSELTKIGKDLSRDFVSQGIGLTEGLVKVGKVNGLNKQQLLRVAEAANIETYLSLIKTAKDKYLEFPLADAKEAFTSLSNDSVKVAEFLSSYDSEPVSSTSVETIFKLYRDKSDMMSDDEISKISTTNDSFIRKEAEALRGKISLIDNALDEQNTVIENDYENLFYLTKQAFIAGIPFSHLKSIIKKAAPLIFEPIIDNFKTKLASIAPHIRLDAEEELYKSGAQSNDLDLHAQSEKLEVGIMKLAKLDNGLIELHKQYEKLANEAKHMCLFKYSGPFGVIGRTSAKTAIGLVDTIRNHPKLSSLTIGLGLGYQRGKAQGIYEQGSILQNAMIRKRNYK